jgi:hypothetical protein
VYIFLDIDASHDSSTNMKSDTEPKDITVLQREGVGGSIDRARKFIKLEQFGCQWDED